MLRTMEEFEKMRREGRRIICTGRRSAFQREQIWDSYLNGLTVTEFLDLSGKEPREEGTISLEQLLQYPPHSFAVLILHAERAEMIRKRLEQKGIGSCFWYYGYLYREERIKRLCGILEDAESKRVVRSLIEARVTGRNTFYEKAQLTSVEALSKTEWKAGEDEIYLDIGANEGEHIEQFRRLSRNRYHTVYALDPSPLACRILKRKFAREASVRCCSLGIQENEKECRLLAIPIGEDTAAWAAISRLAERDGVCLDAQPLEQTLQRPVSLIRLDLGGSEQAALKGLSGILKQDYPRLFTALYHNVEDLFEIPALIREIAPEYKLSIRHYSGSFLNTFLLAKRE